MAAEFEFLNRTFRPIGTLTRRDFQTVIRHCRSIGISNYHGGKWNYKEFYEKAKAANADKIDVFYLDGSTIVIPRENELFAFNGPFRKLPSISKPFIFTFHLLLEANDPKEAEKVAHNCLDRLLEAEVIKDWAYTKDPNGVYRNVEEIEDLDLSEYEDGKAFKKISCSINR